MSQAVPHHCERCGNPLRPSSMTPDEFRAHFKLGDIIVGWSTRKRCRITAIGEERFLYRDLALDAFRNNSIERVAKIRQGFLWELAN